MPEFLSDIECWRDAKTDIWILSAPLEYKTSIDGIPYTISVPKGFVTDFASIPQLFQNLITKNGPWDRAAIIHDYCYTMQLWPKPTADDFLLEAMKVDGVSAIKRRLIFWAVKYFGSSAWNEHRRANEVQQSINRFIKNHS